MDHRLYFVIGDLISNVVAGILIAFCAALLIGTNWNMFLAMFVMMVLGMLLCIFLSLALGILFGAMEIMVPVMLTGMFSGMFSAMWLAMMDVAAVQLVFIGALTGVVVTSTIWMVNVRLRGIATTEPD